MGQLHWASLVCSCHLCDFLGNTEGLEVPDIILLIGEQSLHF